MHDPKLTAAQSLATKPDYTVFIPRYKDYESDNEHIHIFRHKKLGERGLVGIWTQSTKEGTGDNHAVIAYSTDDGKSWTEPRFVVGAKKTSDYSDKQASWAFPIVSASGRIYLFYSREADTFDYARQTSGIMSCIYSDDLGSTWSDYTDIPMRMTPYDIGQVQNNIVFQIPTKTADGAHLIGYTKWSGPKVSKASGESRIYFMKIYNIDTDPEPADFEVRFFPEDENGLTVPHPTTAESSIAQEPCIVTLPDGRLFCSMRTGAGCVYWSTSSDLGESWTKPEPLRFDDGTPFKNPVSPCPTYSLDNGKYVQLYHGHTDRVRNPLRKAYGYYTKEDRQPIRFKKSEDTEYMKLPDDAPLGYCMLSMYSSVTKINGRHILWYPDRKFFVLGKEL